MLEIHLYVFLEDTYRQKSLILELVLPGALNRCFGLKCSGCIVTVTKESNLGYHKLAGRIHLHITWEEGKPPCKFKLTAVPV